MMRRRFRSLSAERLRDAGATLVEYALVFSMFVVTAMGAIQYMTERAEQQVDNSANCIATRPPPPECLVPVLPPTTSTTVPPSTATTTPPAPAETFDVEYTLSAVVGTTNFSVNTTVMQEDPEGGPDIPVPGVTIYYRVICEPSMFTQFVNRTSDDAGWAGIATFTCPEGSTRVRVQIYRINDQTDNMPPVQSVDFT